MFSHGLVVRPTSPTHAPQRQSLNGTWHFWPQRPGAAAVEVRVPSMWTHGTAWRYPAEWQGLGAATYERALEIPALEGCRTAWLCFEAVMLRCRVFLGDEPVGEHHGGFTPFEFDVSAWAGQSLPLRVEVQSAESAYTEAGLEWPISYPRDKEEGPLPGGIWQPVWLELRPAVFVKDYHVRTSVREKTVEVEVCLESRLASPRPVRVSLVPGLGETADFALLGDEIELSAGTTTIAQAHPLGDLPLWSPESPRLLMGEIQVSDRSTGELISVQPIRFGLREFWIEGRDFMLNGRRIHLLGDSLVRHRISPHTWRKDYLRRYFQACKDLGMNCLRTHGSIAPRPVFEAADEVGILIQNQSALWSDGIFSYYEAGELFLENAKKEFEAWYYRDRNHPSVVLWDVENEQIRILPKALPMVQELVDHLRELGANIPVIASACSAMRAGDIFHEHCGPNPTEIIRRWKAGTEARPFIHGEWWGDQTQALSRCYLFTGMAGIHRLPQQFQNREEVIRAAAYLYAKQIMADRLEGVSGTTSFSFERLAFLPIFAPDEPLTVRATEDDPVSFDYPDHHEDHGLHLIRRPMVNPGWDPSLPEVKLDPSFEIALKEAFAPFLVGFLEPGPHSDASGVFRRTLLAVNDFAEPVSGTLHLLIGSEDRLSFSVDLPSAGTVSHSVDWKPLSATEGPLEIVVEWDLGPAKQGRRGVTQWVPMVSENREAHELRRPIRVTGALQTTLDWLAERFHEVTEHRGDEAPAPASVWVLGSDARPRPEAVRSFLNRGGSVVLLRQERQPRFLAGMLEHKSSLRPLQTNHDGWGLQNPGRDLAKVAQVPVTEASHPLLRGVCCLPTPVCPQGAVRDWNARDGRVADDTFVLPESLESQGRGHVTCVLGGPSTHELTLAEIQGFSGRLLCCQLCIEENLGQTPESEQLLMNLVRHAACEVAKGSATFALTGEAPPAEALDGLPEPVSIAEADLCLHLSTQVSDVLAEASQPASSLRQFLERGGQMLVLPPPEKSFEEAMADEDPTPVILSVGDRHDPLASGGGASFFEAYLGTPPRWLSPEGESIIKAFRAPLNSPIAGLAVEPVGDFWQRHNFGAGALHLCAAFFGPQPIAFRELLARVLINAGVPVNLPEIKPVEIPHYTVYRTRKPVPLDGDLTKWTNEEMDDNIAPWSHAQRAILQPEISPRFPKVTGVYEAEHCGGLAYALWDEAAVYFCVVGVSRGMTDPPRSAFIWDYTSAMIAFGFHKLFIARNPEGSLRHLVSGDFDHEMEDQLRLAVHEVEGVPDHPEMATLALNPTETFKTLIFQAAVPWPLLKRQAPGEDDESPTLTFKYLFCDESGTEKTGDLAAPIGPKGNAVHFETRFAKTFRA